LTFDLKVSGLGFDLWPQGQCMPSSCHGLYV